MRSKRRCSCVLQFTRLHAVSCVLHRPTSRVIHHSRLSFYFILFFYIFNIQVLVLLCNSQYEYWKKHFDVNHYILFNIGLTCTTSMVQYTLQVQVNIQLWQTCKAKRTSKLLKWSKRKTNIDESITINTQYHLFTNTVFCIKIILWFFLSSLMILPQVHLRKPCYDFYFL
jgi:hypothetical protein